MKQKRPKYVTVTPGMYVTTNHKGDVIHAGDTPPLPVTHVTCRRVADFGGAMGGVIPTGAGRDRCDTCNCEVVYNPDPKSLGMQHVAAGATRRCQPCSGIEPMPFPKEK